MAEQNVDSRSIQDILREQTALEEEAEAQLTQDWGDENKCTFNEGYVTQNVYACKTCSAKSGQVVCDHVHAPLSQGQRPEHFSMHTNAHDAHLR